MEKNALRTGGEVPSRFVAAAVPKPAACVNEDRRIMSKLSKKEQRVRRHRHIRNKVAGTPEMPRLCVCRTGAHIYAQVIDDEAGRTLVAASTVEKVFRDQRLAANVKSAQVIGAAIAQRALEKEIKTVVFDRGGFPYHGCVKALADAAREAGLQF